MTSGDSNLKRPAADLRHALFDVALELLDAEGPSRLSVRAIARRLGVSHSAAARHFPNRKALLTEMAAVALRELTQRIERARIGSPAGAERWRAVGAAAFDYAKRAPHRYALCWRFDEMLVENERWRAAGEDLCARLREALAIPRFAAGDSLVAAGSLLNGYVMLRDSGALCARVPVPA